MHKLLVISICTIAATAAGMSQVQTQHAQQTSTSSSISTSALYKLQGRFVPILGSNIFKGRAVVAEEIDKKISLRDIATGKELIALSLCSKAQCLTISPDNQYIAIGFIRLKIVEVFEIASGKSVRTFCASHRYGDSGTSVKLISFHDDHVAVVWSAIDKYWPLTFHADYFGIHHDCHLSSCEPFMYAAQNSIGRYEALRIDSKNQKWFARLSNHKLCVNDRCVLDIPRDGICVDLLFEEVDRIKEHEISYWCKVPGFPEPLRAVTPIRFKCKDGITRLVSNILIFDGISGKHQQVIQRWDIKKKICVEQAVIERASLFTPEAWHILLDGKGGVMYHSPENGLVKLAMTPVQALNSKL